MWINAVLLLSLIDLCLTHYYVSLYKEWDSDRFYNEMEGNPLLCFLFNKFGHDVGIVIGGFIIMFLMYLVVNLANFFFTIILLVVLIIAIVRSIINIEKLKKLMIEYSDGDIK
jgi:hypothetical protein